MSHLDDLVVLELLGQVVPRGGKFLLEKKLIWIRLISLGTSVYLPGSVRTTGRRTWQSGRPPWCEMRSCVRSARRGPSLPWPPRAQGRSPEGGNLNLKRWNKYGKTCTKWKWSWNNRNSNRAQHKVKSEDENLTEKYLEVVTAFKSFFFISHKSRISPILSLCTMTTG